MSTKHVARATQNDFSQFEDEQLLQLYNHYSPRKLSGFYDRSAMERRLTDLLDMRGLMVHHENNGGAKEQLYGIWLYRAEAHPRNIHNLGHVHRDSNRIIRLLVSHNPKRGASRERFALYRDGMTVYEYKVACRNAFGGLAYEKAESDVDWDVGKGFIRVEVDSSQQLADHAVELLSQRGGG